MEIFIFSVISTMVLCAFIYDYCADSVRDKCFSSLTKQEAIDLFGEECIVDEDDDEITIFDSSKASKYIITMLITYYPSFPVRWVMRSIYK